MIVKYAVIVFPGINCEPETIDALKQLDNSSVDLVWHESKQNLDQYHCLIIPGGYSYWDYLRPGAISAKLSPLKDAILKFAAKGRIILGICNGFQILQELDLLPGRLLFNSNVSFACQFVHLKCVQSPSRFTSLCKEARPIQIPIAHSLGRFYCDEKTRIELKQNNQIVLQYCDQYGNCTPQSNPNGSLDSIAAISNKEGTVFGSMPHPERAMDTHLGSSDGILIFKSIHQSIQND